MTKICAIIGCSPMYFPWGFDEEDEGCAALKLMLLNQMFELHLSDQQLIDYAARLGADCPFFVIGKPAYAEGIGEQLHAIDIDLKGYWLAVVRPDIPVSTKEAFSLIKPKRPLKNCRDIVLQPIETWKDELVNGMNPQWRDLVGEVLGDPEMV